MQYHEGHEGKKTYFSIQICGCGRRKLTSGPVMMLRSSRAIHNERRSDMRSRDSRRKQSFVFFVSYVVIPLRSISHPPFSSNSTMSIA